MNRKLIIDGNEVYEIDEECMLKKRLDKEKLKEDESKNSHQDKRKEAE